MAEPAIVASGLSKTYHTIRRGSGFVGGLKSLLVPDRIAKVAVDRVSFRVGEGELLALLGPNGAGKSTTIKLLTGILVPSSGEVRVAGLVPREQRERNARNIGAVFGQRTQLWWDLPVRESFSILRDIYDVNPDEHRRRLSEFDELLGLSEFWDTRVRHLSLGQRVRCDVAAALLHDPKVVFLDEPTIGMDVVVKEQVREFLRFQVEKRGRTVVLTTHDMTEVDRLAERMVLINHGRLVFDGSLEQLRRRFGDNWQVRVSLAAPSEQVSVPGVRVLAIDGPRVVFGPPAPEDRSPVEDGSGDEGPIGSGERSGPARSPQEALRRILERYPVLDSRIEENDLEDVMRAAYLQAHPEHDDSEATG